MAPLPDRFRDALEALTGAAPSPGTRLGLAVSGGPDSLALLLLAHAAWPDAIAAATVDHGLRAEAAAEAAHVARICEGLNVPHAILSPPEPIAGNIQSAARAARYALLDAWSEAESLAWVATAHHADDQIETVLMRLMRGSGIEGLSAIRPVNGRYVRPLLAMRKAALVEYVRAHGIAAIEDPSNSDDGFDRVRLRKALRDLPDYDPALVERAMTAAREAGEALQWARDREAKAHVERVGENLILARTDYPRDLLRRLVLHCLESLDPDIAPRGPALDRLLATLRRGEKATIGEILCAPDKQGNWRFSKAPARRTG
ncbi:tRNA lysidine(34) synthetase TilS [Parasphingopyxis marina]|uniref:tRNA(Ile)-lysidine synthase n=1 Tax=Parasphingopyxis marina TaxID=2761622 RepID=A0A842I0C5_9SPHN|nr:tRNA lysidine(34) synthetase TilS [Parasphingopyxis marina]MBC2778672.1 tRNA lysidine(34) synthetase TilS [Parasphingopyxis marina]